jgi:uncharacterized membrane protein
MPAYLIFALTAAFFYSISGLFTKQAMAQGCGPLRIFMTQAWFGAILLSPFLFRGAPMPLSAGWQPLLAAVCWFSAYILYVYTLRDGDLSIIGPVAGIKPVFNALLIAMLLREQVPLSTWTACGLAALALFIMRTPSSHGSHSFGRTAIQTLIAVFLLALADLCIQRWAHEWGALRFSAFIFLGAALLSLGLIPRLGKKYTDLSPATRRILFIGAFFACLPGICVGFAIGTFSHGAEVNITYSIHVLITLAVVWIFGRHFNNHEHTANRYIFIRRLIGAAILFISVALIISGRAP